jgi:hypothetical protein
MMQRVPEDIKRYWLSRQWIRTIQFKVQFQYIDARLSKNSELPLLREFLNQRAQVCLTHFSFPCHSVNLKFGRSRRNVRIET